MWEEKLRRALLTLFFVSLCLPVAIQQTALGVLLAFLAYVGWRHKGLSATPLDRPLLGVFAALFLSSLLSPAVLPSLLGYRRLWLVGAFFATYHLIKEPREAWRLVSLLVIVAAVGAVHGLVQHFTGIDLARQLVGKEPKLTPFWFGRQEGFRAEGFFPTGITYAHNLSFPLTFLTVWLFTPQVPWPRRLALLAGWGLMIFALLFSLTRGVWLAYALVLIVLGAVRGGRALLAVGVCGVLLAVALFSAGFGVRERATEIFDLAANIGRSQIWQANLDMIKERPLTGWGYGNYKKFRGPYYQRYPAADTTAHAHSNFLQIWVDGGLLGLGAFLYLFWVMLRLGWQAYQRLPSEAEVLRGLALGGTLSIAGFLLGGLTQYNFGDAEVVIVLWATMGLVLRVREWAGESDKR